MGNTYIENHGEIMEIYKTCGTNGVGNHLDIFDQRHSLEHNDRLRAEYMQFCNLPMSKDYEALLNSNEE